MATKNTGTDKNPSSGDKKPASPDRLVDKKKTKLELTEDDLKKVAGGVSDKW